LAYIGNKPANKAIVASDLDPAVITGQTALASEPASTDEFLISDAGTLKRLDASLIGGGANTPYFYARLGSEITGISGGASTKVTFNTEDFDTGNEYDNSTNYRFTPANGNTYLLHSVVVMGGSSNTILQEAVIKLYKNGSEVFSTRNDTYNNNSNNQSPSLSKIVTGNGSDYYEIYAAPYTGSGTGKIRVNSFFTAFKLIT
jgi:hypothetical protein